MSSLPESDPQKEADYRKALKVAGMDPDTPLPEVRGTGLFGDGSGDADYLRAGVTSISVIATFLGAWAYAVSAWGWFLGLALGWVPSAIFAVAVGFLAFRMWWLVLAAIGLLVLSLMTGLQGI